MKTLIGIVFFIFGLCFGSFVNMLVYRTAGKYKLRKTAFTKATASRNRSFCDYCGRQLRWYENVPIFSWLILRGKTKCCHKRLSLSYPIVELFMGILFLIYFLRFNFLENNIWFWILGLIIVVFLVFSAVFDLKYMILPDFSTVILIGCAIVFMWVPRGGGTPLQYILSALIASGFLLVLNLITKGNGMGMGDVKLAVFMGLFLGYPKTIIAFYVAFIVGAIWGLLLMFFKKATKKSQVPFGPFMILGVFVAWWGDLILKFVTIKLGL